MSLENRRETTYKDKRYDEGMELLNSYPNWKLWDLELECLNKKLIPGLTQTTEAAKHELANLYANGEIEL